MLILADPETGELVEVLPEDIARAEPYDYADYRRVTMAASREQRAAIKAAKEAGEAVGRAEVDYRKALALTIPRMKERHGATLAEQMAKGEDEVSEALDVLRAAEALDRSAMETVRLCRDDRSGLLTLGAWSRAADPDGFR